MSEVLPVDPLYLALTRPAMVGGVTYSAMLINALLTLELFLLSHNLLWLLIAAPIHGVFSLLCLIEPRLFDLLALWLRTRSRAWTSGAVGRWGGSSYAPLPVEVSRESRAWRRAVRRGAVVVWV